MNDDATLLSRYAHEGDEAAFAELVGRHVNLVWGVARRITCDHDLARDVSQTVFSDLARKAHSLPPATIIPGWLYRSASVAALKVLRTNTRRSERERLAMNEPQSNDEAEAHAASVLLPYVDEALAALPDADRDAVLLRYFGGKNFAQIGALAGTSDDAAQKRVTRAVEKLRAQFLRRGIDVSQGAVAAGLALASAQAAPAGMGALLSATAVSSAASVSLIATIATMKTSLILASAVAVATGVAAWEHTQVRTLRQENAALHQMPASPSGETATAPIAAMPDDERVELARLRSEVAKLRQTVKGQAASLAEFQRAQAAIKTGRAGTGAGSGELALETTSIEDQEKQAMHRAVNDLKYIALAARIYASEHQDQLPSSFAAMKTELNLQPDGTAQNISSMDGYEFFPQPRVIGENEPQLILFREKTARQLSDGTFQRCYAMVDGSVQTTRSPDGNFAKFEKEGTAQAIAAASGQ